MDGPKCFILMCKYKTKYKKGALFKNHRDDKNVLIQIDKDDCNNKVVCQNDFFVKIESKLCDYLLAINDLNERLNTFEDKKYVQLIMSLRDNTILECSLNKADLKERTELCVLYIGNLSQLESRFKNGVYFVLQMADGDLYNEVKKNIKSEEKYLQSLQVIVLNAAELKEMEPMLVTKTSCPKLKHLYGTYSNDSAEVRRINKKSNQKENKQLYASDPSKTFFGLNNNENMSSKTSNHSQTVTEEHSNRESDVSLNQYTCKKKAFCSFEYDINDTSKKICEICTTVIPKYSKFCTTCKELQQSEENDYNLVEDCNQIAIITNEIVMTCMQCHTHISIGDGIILRNCRHSTCRPCLKKFLKYCNDKECGIEDKHGLCSKLLQECEIKAVMPTKFKNNESNIIYCGNNKCNASFTINPKEIQKEGTCSVCQCTTCFLCGRMHAEFTCEEFQTRESQYNKMVLLPSSSSQDIDFLKFIEPLVIPNIDMFCCSICSNSVNSGMGWLFKKCQHSFCQNCISGYIENNLNKEIILCPFKSDDSKCDRILKLIEIKTTVCAEMYEKYEEIIINSNNNNPNIQRCLNKDCDGYKLNDTDADDIEFKCPKCNFLNCILCQAIHDGLSCIQYKDLISTGMTDEIEQTIKMFGEMIRNGIAMSCPNCQILIMKDEGCDYVQCAHCKCDICWITRGPRWGKNGNGDITGGCKCGVGGVKCHPDCNYCH